MGKRMNRHIAALLLLISLMLPAQSIFAVQEPGEGYVRATFKEIVQTLVLLNGFDINNLKIADEYGRIVHCDLYKKNFSNDALWSGIRGQIISNVLKKQEHFRVRYEIVSPFALGRYDFKNQFFPIADDSAIRTALYINLVYPDNNDADCAGKTDANSIFPQKVMMELNQPLTVDGFSVPKDALEKIMVRLEEAGNKHRQVYGRIRVVVTSAGKGSSLSGFSIAPVVLKGDVVSVDFFIDRDLTEPIGSIQIGHGL